MQKGYFGEFGGRYVSEAVMNQLFALECEYDLTESDRCFWDAYDRYIRDYAGGETPLYLSEKLSEQLGCKLYLKRGDVNDAAWFGPAVGQALLWKRIGYHRLVAETGCGLWGVAVARAAALLDQECVLFVSEQNAPGQASAIRKMKSFGAQVITEEKDGFTAALSYWASHSKDTSMLMTGDWGPYPYTEAVAALQKLLGGEMKAQMLRQEERLPALIAAGARPEYVLGGLYAPFFEDEIILYAAEPAMAEKPQQQDGDRYTGGRTVGIAGGMKTLACQDEKGVIRFQRTAGEQMPVLGPELSFRIMEGQIRLEGVTAEKAAKAKQLAARTEGLSLDAYDACSLALAMEKAERLEEQAYMVVVLNKGEDGQ